MSYVDTLVDDMALYHDGPSRTLQWIPGWGTGMNYPESYQKPDGWTYAGAWGVVTADYSTQLYRPWRVPGPYTGNQAPNTRAHVRDLQLWWLLPSGVWQLADHAMTPIGNAYHASWAGDVNVPGDQRIESGGGFSMRYINYGSYDEYLFHFYGAGGTVPNAYLGAATCFYARKILHDPGGVDDRAQARLLADVAGDWWIYQGASWDDFQTNWPMGYNRFKYLTNDWQLISWYSNNTLSEAQIRANPPPFIGLELIADTPQPPDPPTFEPLVLPTRGKWFPKLTGGKNTWSEHGVTGSPSGKIRRRRGIILME